VRAAEGCKVKKLLAHPPVVQVSVAGGMCSAVELATA